MCVQIEGFDVKRVDEYHLTAIQLGHFVGWEHRPGSANEGRGDKTKNDPQKLAEKKNENQKGKVKHTDTHTESFSTQMWNLKLVYI